MQHFPAHWRLYQVLKARDTPPTQDEVNIARGACTMDVEMVKQYADKLEQISYNVHNMLENQALANQVCYSSISDLSADLCLPDT
jgi:hypothetical protein